MVDAGIHGLIGFEGVGKARKSPVPGIVQIKVLGIRVNCH